MGDDHPGSSQFVHHGHDLGDSPGFAFRGSGQSVVAGGGLAAVKIVSPEAIDLQAVLGVDQDGCA